MDPVSVASAITIALAPFTPFLVEGGKKFAGQAGDAAWKTAQALWERVTRHFSNDNKIKGKVLSLSADPADEKEQAGLVTLLAERLKEKPELMQEFFRVLGGSEESIQQILADRQSWVEGITQEIHGAGIQTVQADRHSIIKHVTQQIRK